MKFEERESVSLCGFCLKGDNSVSAKILKIRSQFYFKKKRRKLEALKNCIKLLLKEQKLIKKRQHRSKLDQGKTWYCVYYFFFSHYYSMYYTSYTWCTGKHGCLSNNPISYPKDLSPSLFLFFGFLVFDLLCFTASVCWSICRIWF